MLPRCPCHLFGQSICVMKRRDRVHRGPITVRKGRGATYLALTQNRGEPSRSEESWRRRKRNCVTRGRDNRTRLVDVSSRASLYQRRRHGCCRTKADLRDGPTPDLKGGTSEVLQTGSRVLAGHADFAFVANSANLIGLGRSSLKYFVAQDLKLIRS